MKTHSADRPLAGIPHDELIRRLAANPQNPAPASEFMARYGEVIRQTVAQAIYKRKGNLGCAAMHPIIEDTVSETYCRLFQNDCQVLRSFKCRYENSIFAYLRKIAYSIASNQLRTHRRQQALGRLQSLEAARDQHDDVAPGSAMILPADLTASQTAERQSTEEMLRASLRLAGRNDNVNRNFIIFKLHFLHGYRSHEIAHIKGLGLSERGIGNTADRMRKYLRNGIELPLQRP